MKINVLCNNDEQLYAALSNEYVNEIIIEADSIDRSAASACRDNGKKAAAALPYIFRDLTYIDVSDFDEVYVRSLDELAYYKDKVNSLVSDYGLYAMNSRAAEFLAEEGIKRITAPIELNEYELRELNCRDKELIVYGFLPMMVSAQCIHKNLQGCDKKPGFMKIKDRTGKNLIVENKCTYCYNLIYNPNPLSLFGVWNKVKKLDPDTVRINLTHENGETAAEIINNCVRAIEGKPADDPDDFTRGHFTRGVE